MIFIIMINNRYRLSLQRFQDSKIPIRRYYKPVSDRRVHPPTNGQTVETFASNRDRDRYFGSIYIYILFIDPILTSSRNCSPFRAAYLERNRDFEHAATIIFSSFLYFDCYPSLSTKRRFLNPSARRWSTTNRRRKRSSLIITRRTNFQSLDQSFVIFYLIQIGRSNSGVQSHGPQDAIERSPR